MTDGKFLAALRNRRGIRSRSLGIWRNSGGILRKAFRCIWVWSRIPFGAQRREGFSSQQDFVRDIWRQFVIRGIIDHVPRGIARTGFRSHPAAVFFEGQANSCAANISGDYIKILLQERIVRDEGPTILRDA